MKLINRNIIHPEITIKSFDDRSYVPDQERCKIYNRQDLINGIDRAKSILVKKQLQAGDKILLTGSTWLEFPVWFFACAELGLPFLVTDYPNIDDKHLVNKRLKIYGEIKAYITDPAFSHNKNFNLNDDIYIDINSFKTTDDVTYKDEFWAEEDSILIYCTSSGTTGSPKLISHSHKFFFDLLERNALLYSLESEDRCLHTKSLHHGSVTGVYFLPSIKYCKYHFYCPHRDIRSKRDRIQANTGSEVDLSVFKNYWPYVVHREKINRVLMFQGMLEDFDLITKTLDKCTDNLDIFVLSPINKKCLDNLIGKNNYTVYSIFGCSETSGPFLLPQIDKNNYISYDGKNFGTILDDFFQLTIDNQLLCVTMPSGEQVYTGDKFSIINDEFIFLGRENLYRIRDKTIYLDLLQDEVANYLNDTDFDITIDSEYDAIYIRYDNDLNLDNLNNLILDKLNDRYVISKNIKVARKKCTTGIKYDHELVRNIARSS